jgi:hypothetical protein
MMPRTALQYQVRRTLNRLVEWKNKRHQITWSDLTPQAGQITDITQVAQGQTDSTRIGDSLNAASIQLRGRVNYGTVGSGEGIFRLIVFQWFDTSTPVASEILNPGTVVGETTTDMYNTDMGNRFKIYMDKSYDVSANGGNPHYRQLINKKIVIPQHLRRVKFNEATTTGSAKFWVLLCSENLNMSIRLDFKLNYSDP